MNEEPDPNSGRLDRIVADVVEIKTRLDRIERRMGLVPDFAPSPPPPRLETPRFQVTPPPVRPNLPDLSTQATASADAELRFGSLVLPRVGAGVTLLGIAYLVSLGIARGFITPMHQFWGAIALCLSAIGIGVWKRAEGFDFGQVLVGLGSCGLYLTFAGGHVFLKLYEGETLVALVLALSFANLIYGALSPSRTFAAIGLLGGMWASLMPMQEDKVVVSLWIHAVIVAVTAAVVARHKWREMALGAWFVSTVSILWPVLSRGPLAAQLSVLYGASLVCLLAYAWSHEGWDFDPRAAFLPFAAVTTGFLAVVVGNSFGRHDTAHELLFGAALIASAWAFKREDVRNALLLSGVLAPFVFAPLGLRSLNDAWTYLGLGAVAALISFKAYPKAFASLSMLGLILGLAMYVGRLVPPAVPLSLFEETLFLVASMGLVVLSAKAVSRWVPNGEAVVTGAAIALSPLVSRFSAVLMGAPAIGASLEVSVVTATLFLSAVSAIVAMRRKWVFLTVFSWVALVVSGLVYVAGVQDLAMSLWVEFTILASMLGVILLSSGALGRSSDSNDTARTMAAFMGWGVFSRLVYVLATTTYGMEGSAAITLGWTLYAAILIVIGFLIDHRPLRLSALAIFGATLGKVLLHDLREVDPAVKVVLLILLGTAMIAGGYWYIRKFEKPNSELTA